MQLQLQKHIPELISLCKKHRIRQLWAFGSVISGDFNKNSDLDFLYEMDDTGMDDKTYYHSFWGFMDALRKLFQREIDLVWYGGITNPYFKEEVEETKVLIYDEAGEKVSV